MSAKESCAAAKWAIEGEMSAAIARISLKINPKCVTAFSPLYWRRKAQSAAIEFDRQLHRHDELRCDVAIDDRPQGGNQQNEAHSRRRSSRQPFPALTAVRRRRQR